MFKSNSNSYNNIVSQFAAQKTIETDPGALQEQKVTAVKNWINLNSIFFSEFLSGNLRAKELAKFKRGLVKIFAAEYKNSLPWDKKRNPHIAFIDSIAGIQDQAIRKNDNLDLLHKILKHVTLLTNYLHEELPKLNQYVIDWEKRHFSEFKQQVIRWLVKDALFFQTMIADKINVWLQDKIEKKEEDLQESELLIEKITASLNNSEVKNMEERLNSVINTLRQPNISESDRNALSQIKIKLDSEILSQMEIEDQLQMDKTVNKRKIEFFKLMLKQDGKYQNMIIDFLTDLDEQLRDTKISANDLINPEKLDLILVENTQLLKFLFVRLPTFDHLVTLWRKSQSENNKLSESSNIHITTDMDAIPTLNSEIELRGAKRKEPEDGKKEEQTERMLRIRN